MVRENNVLKGERGGGNQQFEPKGGEEPKPTCEKLITNLDTAEKVKTNETLPGAG